jgi:hypothetical protein
MNAKRMRSTIKSLFIVHTEQREPVPFVLIFTSSALFCIMNEYVFEMTVLCKKDLCIYVGYCKFTSLFIIIIIIIILTYIFAVSVIGLLLMM